jgi:hypothetical protein
VEFVLSCLTSQGIGVADAHGMIADATVTHPADGLARLVKGCARLDTKRKKMAAVGKTVENPINYVQVAGELKKSAKQQVADAKANVAAQVRLVKGQGAA